MPFDLPVTRHRKLRETSSLRLAIGVKGLSINHTCFRPVSNLGPFACEANVITTTLRKLMQWYFRGSRVKARNWWRVFINARQVGQCRAFIPPHCIEGNLHCGSFAVLSWHRCTLEVNAQPCIQGLLNTRTGCFRPVSNRGPFAC